MIKERKVTRELELSEQQFQFPDFLRSKGLWELVNRKIVCAVLLNISSVFVTTSDI